MEFWLSYHSSRVYLLLHSRSRSSIQLFNTSVFHLSTLVYHLAIPASSATMSCGKNKKAAAANKPKGRPGPKGKFKGFRLQYLESILPTYLQHVSKGTTLSYWAVATAGYWARFNWRNSDLGVEVDEETFKNASVRPDMDGELSVEDEKKKSDIMAKTNKVRNITY
jgi:hypothetical protein